MWVKPASTSTACYVMDWSGGNARAIILGYQPGYINTYNGGYPGVTPETSQLPVTAGIWQQIGYAYDGLRLQGYVNGKQQFDIEVVGAGANYAFGAAQTGFRLGSAYAGSNFYTGSLDGVCVYQRALSAQSMQDLFEDSRLGHPQMLRRMGRVLWGSASAASSTQAPRRLLAGVGA
jgi:hypothetical protein